MAHSILRSRWLFAVVVILLIAIPAAAQSVHVVKPRETLSMIAQHYGTTVQAIAQANGIVNTNLIYAGQVLTIPAGSQPSQPSYSYQSYTVQYGDSLTSVAARFKVTVDSIVAINPITAGSWLYPGQVLVIPSSSPVVQPPVVQPPVVQPPVYNPPSGNYYYVRPGDTLYRIGALLGRNIYDIAEVNGILNLNRIFSGTWLRIP